MKKLGIGPFHRAHNYGALLQVFALQKILDHLGYENYIIDYRNDYVEKQYKLFTFTNKNTKKRIKHFIKDLLIFVKKSRRIKKFNIIKRNVHRYRQFKRK